MSEHIYYQKDTGHYQVAKKIKGKQYSFGTYDTLTEAIHIRDYFKKENWPIEKRLMFSKNTFIHYYNGKYHVRKVIDGLRFSFGVFDNYHDAEYQVELCKKFGWDLRLKPFDCMKYIHKRVHDNGRVVYRVIRWHEGKEEYFGSFNRLEDAQFERDLLMCCNWDYDNLESVDDTIMEGHKFLDGVKGFNVSFYKAPRGRIDYGMI